MVVVLAQEEKRISESNIALEKIFLWETVDGTLKHQAPLVAETIRIQIISTSNNSFSLCFVSNKINP